MQINSRIYFSSAEKMDELPDDSIELIVTSPPYPMIAMWDDIFSDLSEEASDALACGDGLHAWAGMHAVLDRVWNECARVLKPGGIACINIGDATRKIGDDFMLYPNHSRIVSAMSGAGLASLPMIHWFKPTNAPNKFMGSGMLPAGAYVTLEHEYILLFRKGSKRCFDAEQQEIRRRSAFFWEERNRWFSDIWDFRGVNQPLDSDSAAAAARERSGAFPFELPFRLINMYSIQGDMVLDPFLGTGTTLAAAIVCGRGCTGYETDSGLRHVIRQRAAAAADGAAAMNEGRLRLHREFIEQRSAEKGIPGYENEYYGVPVVTRQERSIRLPELQSFDAAELSAGYRRDVRDE